MKRAIGIMYLLFFFSCNNTNVKESPMVDSPGSNIALLPTYKGLLPNKQFGSIVLSFIKENPCQSCIYEIYIDKVYPTKTVITLKERANNIEYLEKQNPLFTISFDQKQFFIYSGLEDIFVGDKKLMTYKEKDTSGNVFVEWGVIIDSGRYSVDKRFEGIPFFPSEPIKLR